MFAGRLQLEQVDHVDESDLEIRKLSAQKRYGSKRLLSRNIASRSDNGVWLTRFVVAGPIPNADTLGAVGDRGVHIEVLQVLLFVADDHVDVVLAAQAMIGDGEQSIHIRRQVDSRDIGAFVDDDVKKAGVLVGEAVVILAPDGRRDQKIQ